MTFPSRRPADYDASEKRSLGKGVFRKCDGCGQTLPAEQMIANMRFNGYSKEAVVAPAVRRRFDETFAASGDKFDQPVRIDCFGPAS